MEKGRHDDAGGRAHAALRCVCGHDIVYEARSEGERIGYLVFFDDEPTSGTYGQRIKCCPGCGEQLGLPVLRRRNKPG